MRIYTIGFTKKTAELFFGLIKNNGIELLIDVRLNNKSQLAGFAKDKDLKFFLKEICNCEYIHEDVFAPTKEILDSYKGNKIFWEEYEYLYKKLLNSRNVQELFVKKYKKYNAVCLLCSEHTPEHCHRRILAEYINENCPQIDVLDIVHI